MNLELSLKPNRRVWNRIVAQPLPLILFISVVLRLVVALGMGNEVVELPGIFDQISYHNLALRVANGYGFSFDQLWWPITPANAPTAHWSFLYTLYLAVIYSLFGPYPVIARILQAVIVGILHPYLAYRMGEKLFTKNAGFLAAVITAVYIYFFYYGAALMTEPFYITAILFSLYFSIQLTESTNKNQDVKLGFALGLSLAITLLLRQVYLLFLPFLFLWIWFVRFKRNRQLPILPTALSVALVVLFILPVTLYNQSRFGSFVLLNTNSGYAFFWGNHSVHGTEFVPILPTETYQELIPEDVRHLNEAELDRELLRRGVQLVLDDPQRYIALSLSRIPPYFMFWYSSSSGMLSNISRIASFGVMLPFMVLGLVLAVREIMSEEVNRLLNLLSSPAGLLIIFVIVYSVIHILTWTLIRYRLPVDAVLIPFAGLALTEIAQRFCIRT